MHMFRKFGLLALWAVLSLPAGLRQAADKVAVLSKATSA